MATLPPTRTPRRHDLDWLRVIAFGLLILYHLGMFYVTWDWHVKSSHQSTFAEPAMLLLNPWRLALLFFISGVGVRYALDKRSAGAFIRDRTRRLLIPLIFGMALIVMPQAYVELLDKGEIPPGVFAFWSEYLTLPPGPFSIIVPSWHHLWYVAYVLVYAILAALLSPVLLRIAAGPANGFLDAMSRDRSGLLLIGVVALPFLLYRWTLDPVFPTTHAMIDDWANHAHSFTIFLIGYIVAKDERFWTAVDRHWRKALLVSLALGAMTVTARLNWPTIRSNDAAVAAIQLARAFYAWTVIVTLLGLARRFLNRPSPALTYLTAAIFPFYIPHQTIIVIVGWSLSDARLSAIVEASTILAATVIGSVAIYEFVRRIQPLRPLFGLPWQDAGAAMGNPRPFRGPST